MFPHFENLQRLGQSNIERVLAYQTSSAKFLQAVAAEAADHAKTSLEQGTAAFEHLVAVKTLDKAVAIQTAYAQGAYETLVARAKKIGELYAGFAKETFKRFAA
jgi:hypothetical protein